MTAKSERVLIAMAGTMALVLTGTERGTTWLVEDAPGDGLWVVTAPPQVATTKWTQWQRPSAEEILAYQNVVEELYSQH
jgi:hypothetical protein